MNDTEIFNLITDVGDEYLGQTGNEPLGSYLSLQRFAPAGSFYYNGAYVSNFKSEPKILITKSDGSYLYLTTDIATVINRLNKNDFDKTLYVVDKRQALHFEQLISSIKYFGFDNKNYSHISFGTINDENGNPFKTRDGGSKKLIDLFDETCDYLKKNK